MFKAKYPLFLQDELTSHDPSSSFFHVVPVPYEKTVSYGHGTSKGPQAILNASYYLEAFNGKNIPLKKGIYTHPPLSCKEKPEIVLARIKNKVNEILDQNSFPVIIGGEHTITSPIISAYLEKKIPIGVIQIDAHADLRDEYEGSRLSHACVMRRIWEQEVPFYQIGVRSLSIEEFEFRKTNNILHLDAEQAVKEHITSIKLPADFPSLIYLTIDIDGIDPSLFPATGTPEAGGLGWYQTHDLIASTLAGRKLAGFDLVEHAPLKGFHSADFAASRLIYNVMGMAD